MREASLATGRYHADRKSSPRTPVSQYLRPADLPTALDALRSHSYVVLAGGTDHYPARVGKPLTDDVLDLSALVELRGITEHPDHWRIGALTTWTDVLEATHLPPLFDGLRLAAREIGGVQIQNAGTLCGNLCNASPAADGVPPLLALGARVKLRSATATLTLALEDFILGPRRTALQAGQIMTAILVPKPARAAAGHFLKLGARRYLVVSIAMASAVIETSNTGIVTAARVAVGSCSPVARRLPALEAALLSCPANAQLGAVVAASHLTPLAPIDDVRASREYRRDATLTLLRRLLNELGARA